MSHCSPCNTLYAVDDFVELWHSLFQTILWNTFLYQPRKQQLILFLQLPCILHFNWELLYSSYCSELKSKSLLKLHFCYTYQEQITSKTDVREHSHPQRHFMTLKTQVRGHRHLCIGMFYTKHFTVILADKDHFIKIKDFWWIFPLGLYTLALVNAIKIACIFCNSHAPTNTVHLPVLNCHIISLPELLP